jgi:colicin import membrane protein
VPSGDVHERPRQPGKIRSILLAVAVHLAFFALIVFGVTWQSRPTPPLQAELWDKLPPGKPAAVPKAAPEPPKPEPPKVEPKPEPPKPAPPKVEPKPEPPKPDPAIAEKKEREKKERLERERKEQERLEREKKEQERLEREKKEREKKERERKEREKKEQERKEREAKAAEAKARAEEEARVKAAAEAAAQARKSEIDGYIGRIRDKIRGKANVPDTVRGQPEVQVRITILPGGDVLDIVIVKSSGNRLYDTAIERAIRSAQPLPVPNNPELFAQFRSLTLNIQHER